MILAREMHIRYVESQKNRAISSYARSYVEYLAVFVVPVHKDMYLRFSK